MELKTACRDRYMHPRDEILKAMERIYQYRMTTTSGGNLSIMERNGDVWITPARIDKGALRREDIVCVHADGNVEGIRKPSSELPIHQEIRRRRPELGGVVHAHPVALVAFSLVHEAPNTRVFHQSRRVCGEVGFVPYALPGSQALGKVVADTFEKGYDCVIMENHGVVTAGATFQEAFRRFETLEFTGKTLIKAKLLGGEVRFLTDEQVNLEQRRFSGLEEFAPDCPSSQENEARRRLCEFVRRGYRQRLFISTQGSFSARVTARSFLITPSEVDRAQIEVDDLVLVEDGRSEAGKHPSKARCDSRSHLPPASGYWRDHQRVSGERDCIQCHWRSARHANHPGELRGGPACGADTVRATVRRWPGTGASPDAETTGAHSGK